jgi:hypothetical protein
VAGKRAPPGHNGPQGPERSTGRIAPWWIPMVAPKTTFIRPMSDKERVPKKDVKRNVGIRVIARSLGEQVNRKILVMGPPAASRFGCRWVNRVQGVGASPAPPSPGAAFYTAESGGRADAPAIVAVRLVAAPPCPAPGPRALASHRAIEPPPVVVPPPGEPSGRRSNRNPRPSDLFSKVKSDLTGSSRKRLAARNPS